MQVRKWAKTSQPNPFTYKTEGTEKLLSQKPKIPSISFVKAARKTFQDELIRKEAKNKNPGAGTYSIESAETRLHRPTVRKRWILSKKLN